MQLPEAEIFNQMASQEALGDQYKRLYEAGWNRDDVREYILREKYLPLLRHVTGQDHFDANFKLSPEQMNKLRDEIVSRQIFGLQRNLAFRSPFAKQTEENNSKLYSRAQEQSYRDYLNAAFDKRVEAFRKGDKLTEADYDDLPMTDFMKKSPELRNALKQTSMNIW